MSQSTPSRVALVTGAGSGIGRACALALLSHDYCVVLAGRRREPLEDVARTASDRALVWPTDVTDPRQVAALFEAARERFGRLDVLFNNAGRGLPPTPIEELPLDQWRAVLAVNLDGLFLCAQQAVRLMKAQRPRGGRIINNGSISAHAPRPNSAAYTASKHAVTGLTRSLALDGRPYDIACSQIDIGNAHTELAAPMATGVPQADGSLRPEPMMDLEHVANAVLYIAGLPLDANVQFMTLLATKMPYVGRG